MKSKDTFTPSERKALQKLLKKRRKKLKDQKRFDELATMGNILGKVDAEEPTKPEDEVDLQRDIDSDVDVTTGPEPAVEVLEVTVTDRVKVFCSVTVNVESGLDPMSLREMLQAMAENLDRDDFIVDPDLDSSGMEISSSILNLGPAERYTRYPEPDFLIGHGVHEDDGPGVVGIKDVRQFEKKEVCGELGGDEFLEGELLTDNDGAPIQLNAADAGSIYNMLASQVGVCKTRGRLEDAAREIELLTKIGPEGRRLSPHLKKLSHDDKAVPPEVATSKR